MHPTGVASAAWVFASAPSKVPFYIAGGLLACWAVALFATGMRRPEFPRSQAGARLVMLTSVLLVASTLTAAVGTGGGPSEPHEALGGLQLAADPAGQIAYDKRHAAVKAGTVVIRFANRSAVPHNVTIARGGETVAASRTIQRGATALTANLPPGDYVFFCSVDAHRQAGMEGTLSVR
jgi:plastocyanin